MYFKKDTGLPQFMPQPVFLQDMNLSLSARQLYTLLLNRTTLSQKNNWVDQDGRVYVIYTVDHMAADLGRSRRTVERAQNELEKARLIRRRHRGLNLANHIYIRFPSGEGADVSRKPEEGEMSPPEVTKTAPLGVTKMAPPDVTKMAPLEVPKWHSNYTEENQTKKNQLRREGAERPSPSGCGRYENVFLSAEQRQELEGIYGQTETDRCIERLSEYMKTTGRRYADHSAVLAKWLREDREKAPARDRWSAAMDYHDYDEGDVL